MNGTPDGHASAPGSRDDADDNAALPEAVGAIRYVLVEPSHAGNIGASARALATMGFDRLVVVAPRDADFKSDREARALAVGAAPLLDDAAVAASLDDVLGDCTLSFAMTGYDREYGPPLRDLRSAARLAIDHLAAGRGDVAFVFGTERTGLGNRDVERCHYSCAIRADPRFASLNLAQAVQVAAYECRMAQLAVSPETSLASRFDEEPPPKVGDIEAMHEHLERGLVALGVLDPQAPRRTMARLRRLFARAQPSAADVALLRGIFAAMVERKLERAGSRGGRRAKARGLAQGTGANVQGAPRRSR